MSTKWIKSRKKLVFELGKDDHWTTDENWPLKVYDLEAGKIYVAAPVLDFTIHDIVGSDEWYEKAHQVLEGWLKLCEFNIAMRTVGLPIARYPDEYKTNETLEIIDHINDPVTPGGSYTEGCNLGYAGDKIEFKNLLKRVYTILLQFREPDEVGDKVAWLLEQELGSEQSLSPYKYALLNYRVRSAKQ